jgi:hypothetical protein
MRELTTVPPLLEQDECHQLLGSLPEWQKLRRIQGLAIDVLVDHGAFELQVYHDPL